MEVLELNGTRFMKATAVARDLGYTADYVGQLCRAGKISGHLVGRSWYVDENELKNHKSTRYRSTKAKSKAALKEEVSKVAIRTIDSGHTQVSKEIRSPFYNKSNHPRVSAYSEDASDLIPVLTRREDAPPTKIAIALAESKNISITKATRQYKLEATELPKIRFKGNVTVEHPEEVVEKVKKTSESKNTAIKPTPGTHKLSVSDTSAIPRKKPKHITVVAEDTEEQPKKVAIVSFQERLKTTKPVAVESTAFRTVQVRDATPARSIPMVSSVTVALLLAVSCVLIALSLDYSVMSNNSEGAYHVSLNFNISNAMQSLSDLK